MLSFPQKPIENKPTPRLETIAMSVTRAVGSIWSIGIHTVIFVGAFTLILFGFNVDRVLLVLTTVLSLEAIYLSLFIQLSVNHQAKALASVEKDIDEIAEDVEEMQEDMEGIAEDVEEIAEDVEEINKDIDEIQEDVEEIQEDVEEIQEDYSEEEILDEILDTKLDHENHTTR